MIRRILLASTAAFLILSCQREASNPASDKPPVILISIDTLRSDHLPAYGCRGVATPNIDALRRDSILYTRAYSNSPMTLPSHASIMTGLLPADHGVRNDIGYRLDAKKSGSLPCVLHHLGYATGAAVSSYVLRAESGIGGCFDQYDDAIDPQPGAEFPDYQRPGVKTLAAAETWIGEDRKSPFFYFFHIGEPHVPYIPPEPYRSRYASAYDEEIAFSDEIIGKFLDFLKKSGVYDRAVIILLSDHGEGLGDHGEARHSIFLYREAIQVPLMMKMPKSDRGGTTVNEPAQLIDVAPTIEALLGGSWNADLDGMPLVTLASGNADRKIFSETMYPRIHLGWSDLSSLISGRYHYISGPRPELYDIVNDPEEKKDLAHDERQMALAMNALIDPYRKPLPPMESVDPEAAKKLAALGYLGTMRTKAASARLPNPRDQIRFLERFRSALLLADQGKDRESAEALRSIIAANPSMVEAWANLAEVQTREGDCESAARSYHEAIGRSAVLMPDVVVQAGFNLLRLGRLDEANALARPALSDLPQKANELIARVALAHKDLAAANDAARRAIDAGRSDPADLALLAEIQDSSGAPAEAWATLDRAESRARELGAGPVFNVSFLRGEIRARANDQAGARALYEKEIADFPHHLEAYASLAIVEFIEGNRAAVDQTLEAMYAKNPTAAACLLAANTLEGLENVKGAQRWRERATK